MGLTVKRCNLCSSWTIRTKRCQEVQGTKRTKFSWRGSRILKWEVNFSLDDDNATSLKHWNEAFWDYMLDSVFVGSEWIIDRKNQLSLIRILHLNQRNQRNQILFQYLRDKKKKKKEGGLRKRGRGWKFTHFASPGSAPAQIVQLENSVPEPVAYWTALMNRWSICKFKLRWIIVITSSGCPG